MATRTAWNKEKSVGQKKPLSPNEIKSIKHILGNDNSLQGLRDLTLLSVAVDTMLRGCDLVKLTVDDITDHEGQVIHEFTLQQKKTGQGNTLALTPETRATVARWIDKTHKLERDYLFTRTRAKTSEPISTTAYLNLINAWVVLLNLDPQGYGTHSLRRTKAAYIYAKTKNIEAIRQLLGQKSIASTSAYLGIDQQEAMNVGRKFETVF
ncbi:MAG: tyrosine-type recombinase/integrase [Pseudomonadales bacterium]